MEGGTRAVVFWHAVTPWMFGARSISAIWNAVQRFSSPIAPDVLAPKLGESCERGKYRRVPWQVQRVVNSSGLPHA